MLRSRILFCVTALLGVMTPFALAQAPPPKLIRIVVPFSAGASNDVIARALAVPLAKRLDIPVIVENKAGAAGVIGADSVAKSPHDGSVLLLTSSTFLTAAATQAQLPYDPLNAFAPIAMIGQGPLLLAVSSSSFAFSFPLLIISFAFSSSEDSEASSFAFPFPLFIVSFTFSSSKDSGDAYAQSGKFLGEVTSR